MTKSANKPTILTTNHTMQIKWLDGQIIKNNNSIFLNPNLALKAYEKLKDENMGILNGEETEAFIAR